MCRAAANLSAVRATLLAPHAPRPRAQGGPQRLHAEQVSPTNVSRAVTLFMRPPLEGAVGTVSGAGQAAASMAANSSGLSVSLCTPGVRAR